MTRHTKVNRTVACVGMLGLVILGLVACCSGCDELAMYGGYDYGYGYSSLDVEASMRITDDWSAAQDRAMDGWIDYVTGPHWYW